MANSWTMKRLSVAGLQLDPKNPRLGRSTGKATPRQLIQRLFAHDKAMEVAQSIAVRGYFANEPLLVIKEGSHYVVVEGNRRLAALKALHEPDLLEPPYRRLVQSARRVADLTQLLRVPVVIAPDRRATDQLVAGRHVGTPVLPWEAENRANFILEKLDEGYDTVELTEDLGFQPSAVLEAKQTIAIVDMARSLDLPEDVKEKLDNPRAAIFSTIKRVFDSSVGRDILRVEPDAEHGYRGNTSKEAFTKSYIRLVTDIASRAQSSRTLNSSEQIRDYLNSWNLSDLPGNQTGNFVPSDLMTQSAAAQNRSPGASTTKAKPPVKVNPYVLPRDFKIRIKNDRLIDIHRELVRLKRDDFPNAGAVLLRVFVELTFVDYLKRTGEMDSLVQNLGGKGKLPFETPQMKQIVPEMIRVAKTTLSRAEANEVEKALTYNEAAPFTVSDLHSFVHQPIAWPTERDIRQFWQRTEPLLRLLVESDPVGAGD